MHTTRSIGRAVLAIGLATITGIGLGACSWEGPGNKDATPAEFCRLVKAEDARLADLSGRRDAVAKAAKNVKALADSAPSEIRDDVDLLADGYQKAADGDFVALASKMGSLTAAITHVVKYTRDTCDFDLNAR